MKLKHKQQNTRTDCLKTCLEIVLTDELSGKEWDILEHAKARKQVPLNSRKCKITNKNGCVDPCCHHLYYHNKLSEFSYGLKKEKMNKNEIMELILHSMSKPIIMSVGTPYNENHAIVVNTACNIIHDPSQENPCVFESKKNIYDHLTKIYEPNMIIAGRNPDGSNIYRPTNEDEYNKYLVPFDNTERRKVIELITWIE